MKNQYFGDINDYRKYGLLRSVNQVSEIRLLVAWMLTPDDGSTDGKFTAYLESPQKWSHYDPVLYCELQQLLNGEQTRGVNLIENRGLLEDFEYFSEIVPDDVSGREGWFGSLAGRVKDRNFVFLDPDNGLEVKSRPYGRKNSSKFLYWREVEALWAAGKSLLIYQHFIREKRVDYIQRMLGSLAEATPGSLVEAFSTSNVVFLMALQPGHQQFHGKIVGNVKDGWDGQISSWVKRE